MKTLSQATMLIVVVGVLAAAGACASAGGGHGGKCGATPADTIYRPVGVVYRPCGVDRQAQLTSTPRPTFTPNTSGGQSCYTAEFEFVVDEDGKPIMQTVHTLHSNNPGFESSMAQLIPGLHYEPAIKDGQTVKQIAAWKETASVARVVVPAGAGAPVRPPAAHQPPC